jgi:hypothetical protein
MNLSIMTVIKETTMHKKTKLLPFNILASAAVCLFAQSGAYAIGFVTPQTVKNIETHNNALQNNLVQSPYPACQKVLIVSKQAYDNNNGYKSVKLPGGCDEVQAMPDTGMFSGLSSAAQALDFTSMLAEQYEKNINSQLKQLESLQKSLASGCKDADCQALKNEIATVAPELRAETALAGAQVSGKGGLTTADLSAHVNAAGGAVAGMPSPLAGRYLSPDETEAAQATLDSEATMLQKSSNGKMKRNSLALWKALRQKHLEDYQNLIVQHKIFSTLPQATWVDGAPQWTDAQIADALDKQIKAGQAEVAITEDAIKNKRVEFNNRQQAWYALKGGKRDLMSYMAEPTVVNQVLQENPKMCALAAGINQYQNSEQDRDMIGVQAALIGAGLATGGLATAAGEGAVLAGATMTVGMGLGATGYFVGTSDATLAQLKRQQLAGDTDATYAKIEAAQQAKMINVASSVFMVGDVGVLGAAVAKSLGSAMTKAAVKGSLSSADEQVVVRALASAKDPEVAAKALKNPEGLSAPQSANVSKVVDELKHDTVATQDHLQELLTKQAPDQLAVAKDPEIIATLVAAKRGDALHPPVTQAKEDEAVTQALKTCSAEVK